MDNEEKQEFKYKESSKNIFSKIDIVNNYTLEEINKLNDKYKEMGLFIKLVRVDNYGKEKSPSDLISKNFISRKRLLKRHSKMTIEQLYYKYFCVDSFSEKSKNLRSFSKLKGEDELCDIEGYKELQKNINEIHEDFQKLENKKCRIKKNDFKEKIMNYIQRFNKYLTSRQYTDIYNKFKEKSMFYVELNKIDDLYEWPIPLLKEFKAEIEILAIKNNLNKNLGKDIYENEKSKSEKEDKEKDEEENEESNSNSSDSFNSINS